MALVGVMGGTFDPIHLGHLVCAEMARDACGLDEVLFVVAGNPHFKQGISLAPAKDRLAMVQRAIEGKIVLDQIGADGALARGQAPRQGVPVVVTRLEHKALYLDVRSHGNLSASQTLEGIL